ncbi:MAG TPA: recombinase RecT, partial [Alphaproteobacteria bacterium]|nr:recombinase RecT [Alphaproteobacteria bacterium]
MNGTTNDLAVRESDRLEAVQQAALAIKPGQLTWDEYQNAALNQLGLKNASNADRAVFLHQCQRTGLDPFAKQIMMIERREKQGDTWVSKWTIQTGIEGWRTIRDRAERREGVRGVLSRFTYYDHEGTEHKVWVQQRPPIAVEVTYTVRDRNGVETPYTSVLRYDEYVQTKKVTQNGAEIAIPIAQWATKGVHMTEKCTEADVYRKTFPQDYAGIELTDAMPPAEHYDDEPVQQRQRVTAEQARNRAPQRATAEVVSVTPLAPTETIPVGTEHAGDGTQPP